MAYKDVISAARVGQREVQMGPDPLRDLLRRVVQALMDVEADAVCGAHWGTRRRERVNSRNGYRARTWETEVGRIDIAIPKLRRGTYFPGWLLERQRSAERLLTALVLEAYVRGLNARKVTALVTSLGIDRLNRAQLIKLTREMELALNEHRAASAGGEPEAAPPLEQLPDDGPPIHGLDGPPGGGEAGPVGIEAHREGE
jgi:transposase-like protein